MAVLAPPLQMRTQLARRLSGLQGASPQAIEETIALWPLSDRLYLAAHGIIDTHADAAGTTGGRGADFELTERGLEVIDACGDWRFAASGASIGNELPGASNKWSTVPQPAQHHIARAV